MSAVPAPSSSEPPGLVLVTVASASRRVDLALPAGVPLVELLPGLARCVGVLDGAGAQVGLQAMTVDGRALRGDLGLVPQGVRSGDVIAISPSADADAISPRYDDPAEAVAGAVAREPPWDAAWRQITGSAAAALLLVVGAGLLVSTRGRGAALCATLVAAALYAWVVRRVRAGEQTVLVVGLGYATCLYAAVAALCWGWHGSWSGPAVATAGSAGAVTTCAVAGVLSGRRLLMLPALALATVAAGAGLGTAVTRLDMSPFLTVLLAVVVLTSEGWPALALSASGAGRHALRMTLGDTASDAPPVDLTEVASDVARAREILVPAEATTGVLLVALAPEAVSIGPTGAVVPLLGSALLLLRARRCHAAVDVALGVVAGVAGLTATAVSTWLLEEGWRLAAGALLGLTGLLTLTAVLDVAPRGDSARVRRAGDVVESLAVGALLPALLVALGLAWARP
jgi:type VII secretion integral membrane protein EccD